jgi:actin-related protein 8
MFLPSVMGKAEKGPTRHTIIPRSTDLYDGSYNDQESGAQNAMANHLPIPVLNGPTDTERPTQVNPTENPTPSRRPSPSIQSVAGDIPESVIDASRRSASPSAVASPAPGLNGSTPQTEKPANRPATPTQGQASYFPATEKDYYDDELTVANIPSLEYAIATSIKFASLPALSSLTTTNLGEDRSRRLYSSILLVGSGSLIHGMGYMLEDRVRSLKGGTGTVSVIPPPRDIDPGVLVWKGASVFARLKSAEREAFMTRKEWDLYGVRGIPLRVLFAF